MVKHDAKPIDDRDAKIAAVPPIDVDDKNKTP